MKAGVQSVKDGTPADLDQSVSMLCLYYQHNILLYLATTRGPDFEEVVNVGTIYTTVVVNIGGGQAL